MFQAQGMTVVDAKAAAIDLQYGNSNAPVQAATSLDNCLWGEASREFAGSLRPPPIMSPASKTTSALSPRITDGVRAALAGIGPQDARTLAFALDRQRIADGLQEISTVAANAPGTLLFGIQDAAMRTAPVDVRATLAKGAEVVQQDWQSAQSSVQPDRNNETLEHARTRTA